MSPFKLSHLYISLEPDQIALARRWGGWRPSIDADLLISSPGLAKDPSPAMDALAAALSDKAWHTRTAQVILSNALVKSLVVDIVPGIATVRELQQAIDARVADTFGLELANWQVIASLDPFSPRVLACAVQRKLLQGLHDLFSVRKCTLTSVQPFLVSEFNRRHRIVGKATGWFALAEPGHLTLALFRDGHWQGTRTYRTEGHFQTVLASSIARDRLAYEVPESVGQIWLAGLTQDGNRMDQALPATVTMIDASVWPGCTEKWSGHFRRALSPLWP